MLFNLGGPDGPAAVQPFLFNLFRDPAIIAAPGPVRWPLAQFISRTREKSATANYALMGGGSPLLPETERQATALQARLAEQLPDTVVRCFIAMRYWHPLTGETARAVEAFAPDDVVLLPLYPHYSGTTTGSSLKAWTETYRGPGLSRTVCCYPDEDGLIRAHARLIEAEAAKAGRPDAEMQLLFSAHGLPERNVEAGDPYQAQIEATCARVAQALGERWPWRVCYQSRVGPLKWLGPSTPEALADAGASGKGVIVVPIAFVSEHVETLVELDHEYGPLALKGGCPVYLRVPALGIEAAFIDGLAQNVRTALTRAKGVESACGGRWCDARWSQCPARATA